MELEPKRDLKIQKVQVKSNEDLANAGVKQGHAGVMCSEPPTPTAATSPMCVEGRGQPLVLSLKSHQPCS